MAVKKTATKAVKKTAAKAAKPKAPELDIVPFASQKKWEDWLKKHFDKSPGIWMQLYKKASGVPSVDYAQALDVALCYGWIDGQKKSYDADSWLQRFTPRGPKSVWSKINTGHIERLTKEGRMHHAGQKAVDDAMKDGRWDKAYESQSSATVPQDFLDALEKNKKAKAFFATLNKVNLYAIIYRLHSAKKEETRQKRIEAFVEKLSKGEKFY